MLAAKRPPCKHSSTFSPISIPWSRGILGNKPFCQKPFTIRTALFCSGDIYSCFVIRYSV